LDVVRITLPDTNGRVGVNRYRVTAFTPPPHLHPGNAGYNPHGAVTTPTIARATLFTNTTMLPVTVYLKSGTTAPTVLIINGVTSTVLPLISQIVSVPLESGGSIQFTCTVAPTWQWVGN
jgi:hypothetical protein